MRRRTHGWARWALCLGAAGCAAEDGAVVVPDAGSTDRDVPRIDAVPLGPDIPPLDVGAIDRQSTPGVDTGAEGDAGEDAPDVMLTREQYCMGSGPPVLIGPPGMTSCTGRIAERVFRYSLCSCGDLGLAGFLRTDSYDSSRSGMPPGERGGAVGVNGNWGIVGYSQVGDTLTMAGLAALNLVGAHRIRGDFNLAGALNVAGTLNIERNARVRGNILGLGVLEIDRDLTQHPGSSALAVLRVRGARRTAEVNVLPPCPCRASELVDITGAIADGRVRNDNAVVGFSPSHFASVVGRQVTTLPCGRFYVDRVAGLGSIELRVDARTALFVGGDFDLAGFFDVRLGDRGELDVFILGNVLGTGYLRMGGTSRPSGVRIYIAGDRGFTLLGASRFVGNVYAPRAPVTLVGYMNLHGSLFASRISAAGDLDVHYDRSILRVGENCPPTDPPPPGACARCGGNCATGQACVNGNCGMCTTDGDCCEPLVCETRTGRCESIPP